MRFSTLLAIFLPALAVCAAPVKDCTESIPATPVVETTTILTSGTLTVTNTVTPTAGASSAPPITTPTSAYTVISARSGSSVHLLPLNAAGLAFYLGGSPSTYCPLTNASQCPPGIVTAFIGLGALDTLVPGGQTVFVATDGSIGYTQAHSAETPLGSVIGPFTYSKQEGAAYGVLGIDAFGASGFMACKGNGTATYQVFLAMQNATVPTGNISDCLGFDALTSDYSGIAAWQYT